MLKFIPDPGIFSALHDDMRTLERVKRSPVLQELIPVFRGPSSRSVSHPHYVTVTGLARRKLLVNGVLTFETVAGTPNCSFTRILGIPMSSGALSGMENL
jgi:hypothetical protein